jgi:hypothetical protein
MELHHHPTSTPVISRLAIGNFIYLHSLSLLVWHNTVHPPDLRRTEVWISMMNGFAASVRGFQIKELFVQGDCLEHLYATRNSGARYFNHVQGRYGDFPDVNDQNFCDEPRNAGLSRQLAATELSWASPVLVCARPQIGFSRAEQRMLWLAIEEGTDEDLHHKLNLALTTVKKRWRSIYDRTAERLPHLFRDRAPGEILRLERGKERRRRLLAYLRDHPEELRPVSLKLLRQTSATPEKA